MALTPEQRQQVVAYLQTKVVLSRPCGACGQAGDWRTGDDLVISPTIEKGSLVPDGPYVPLIQVFCAHCGYVMHFASAPMGISEHGGASEDNSNMGRERQ
jgi:hypothetical protein